MSKNCFRQIKKMLHVSDNSTLVAPENKTDKCFKVGPMIEMLADLRPCNRYIVITVFTLILARTEIRLDFSGENSGRNPIMRTEAIRPSGRCSI